MVDLSTRIGGDNSLTVYQGATNLLTSKQNFPYTHIFPFHYSHSEMISSCGINPLHRRVAEYRVVIPESPKGLSGIQEERIIPKSSVSLAALGRG
jgi:hypothetical protein